MSSHESLKSREFSMAKNRTGGQSVSKYKEKSKHFFTDFLIALLRYN